MSTIGECRFKEKRLRILLELFSVRNAADLSRQTIPLTRSTDGERSLYGNRLTRIKMLG